jgi:hypothetical protein
MSLHDCIQRAIDSGDLPPARARAAQRLFAERLQAQASLGPGAEAAAAEDVWVHLRREAIRRRRGVLMQARAQMDIADVLARHREPDGQPNAASAMRQLVEWGQSATFQNVHGIAQALESSYLREIGELVTRHKRNLMGKIRNKAGLANIVRELKGEGTGDQKAFSIAQAIKTVLERARQEFNAAGGEIAKLEGYDLPHHWDRRAVARMTPDEFVALLYPEQDWARIMDHATSRPFAASSRDAREAFLRQMHDNIRTGGANRREPSGIGAGTSLGKSRADHRVLHFATADGWLRVNAKIGASNPFGAIVDHLKAMARDTAQMRVLGPNPKAGLEYARQAALKLAVERPWKPGLAVLPNGKKISPYSGPEAEVGAVAAQSRRMLDMVSGAASAPEMDLIASFLSRGLRPFLAASQLGGAMLSAVTDIGFMATAARHTGLNPARLVGRHLQAVGIELVDTAAKLATLGHVDRSRVEARLARLGIIAEAAADTGVVQSRLFGESFAPGFWQNLSELTLRASGLTRWTDIGRGIVKLELYGALAENADRPWAQIDAPLRDMVFAPRGITADDWEDIRRTPLFRHPDDPGASFLIPDDIRARADLDPDRAMDLFLKLQSAIEEQREFFVPSSSLRGRAAFQAGAPGSVGGELIRSALMYKNFPLTLMYNQLGRVLYHKVRGSRFWANVMPFVLVTTLGGLVAMNLKEIAKGNDPRPLNDPRSWLAALLQGGGLGIFGDFVYAAENRFGGGLASTAAGPVVGAVNDTLGLIGAFAGAITEADPDKKAARWDAAQRNAIRFANRFSGPTNLWYLNLAFDRLVWDQLQLAVDGKAQASFDAAAKKATRERGTEAWWPQGNLRPVRLPDLSNLHRDFGGAP